MNYEAEIINIIRSIEDVRFLAFLYGLIDELVKHAEETKAANRFLLLRTGDQSYL